MKLGCSTIHYQFTGWPIWQCLESIASIGYSGIEIEFGKNPFDVEMRPGAKYLIKERTKLKEYLDKLNLKLPSLCIMSSWSGDGNRISESKETLLDVVRLAQLFDIKLIVAVAGPPATSLSRNEVWDQVVKNLKWVSEYTKSYGIKLGMEAVATWPIDNTETFLRSKEIIGENFYVNLDPSNYYQAGDDPIKALKTLQKFLIAVHIKDAKVFEKKVDGVPAARGYAPIGEGDIDFNLLLQTLKEVGFNGWLMAEYEGFFGGYNPDPVKGSQDTYDYIKPILDSM